MMSNGRLYRWCNVLGYKLVTSLHNEGVLLLGSLSDEHFADLSITFFIIVVVVGVKL